MSDCEIIEEEGQASIVTQDGKVRKLGLEPDPNPPQLLSFARALGDIPSRSELIDLVESEEYQRSIGGMAHYDSTWTKDQNGYGKCASSASTYLVEKARHRSGQARIELSDDHLYSLVNGGRDRGSTLGENLRAITQQGIASRAVVKEGQIFRGRYDVPKATKDALRFRGHEGYATASEQEVIASLVSGKAVQIAIHVGRNWQRFDKDGVLIGDRGPGNHSEHLDHVRYNRTKGRFEFREHSSHGTQQGDGGFFWVTWDQHLATVHPSHTFFALPAAVQDPLGDSPFNSIDDIDDKEEDQTNDAPSLIVRSSEFCSWCKIWADKDRPVLQSAGVEIKAGDVPGSGVPRFRLEVGGQSKDKIGYWTAEAILREIADMQTRAIFQR